MTIFIIDPVSIVVVVGTIILFSLVRLLYLAEYVGSKISMWRWKKKLEKMEKKSGDRMI